MRRMGVLRMADLIERDAVLARIDCCLGNSLGGRKEFDSGLMQARKFVISTPAVNRWIPCSERLPETPYEGFGVHFRYSDCVLVAAKDWMGMAYYLTEEGKSWWEFADAQTKQRIDRVEITHWMPLPEPPEVSQDE